MRRPLLFLLFALLFIACAPPPAVPIAHAEWPVLVVADLEGDALFEDEQAEARALLTRWARAHGIAVADPALTTEALARGMRGQDARTGAACGRPLHEFEARERWGARLGAAGTLEASVVCEKECVLTVEATRGLEVGGEALAAWSGPISREAPWREGLAKALASLGPPPPDEGTNQLLAEFGGGNHKATAEHFELSVYPARNVAAAEVDALRFPRGDAAVRACFSDDPSGDVLFAVARDGRVAKCEPTSKKTTASACLCHALVEAAETTPLARGARFHVNATRTPADPLTTRGAYEVAYVQTHLVPRKNRFVPLVTDRSIDDWTPPAPDALRTCFEGRAANEKATARVRTTFDARGAAAAAVVESAKGMSDAEIACVSHLFTTRAVAPCPDKAGAQAVAEVVVETSVPTN